MEAADVATPLGAWASIRGYFTPATLFLVLNLVIGTIALTSRSQQRRRRERHLHHDYAQAHYQAPPLDPQQDEYSYYQQQPHQYATPPPPPLARTSSVLERLRSFGLYRFRSDDFPPEYGAGANGQDAFPSVEEETAKQYARSRSEPAPAREESWAPPPRMKKSGADVVRKAHAARAPAPTRVFEAVAEAEAVDARAEEEFIGSLRQGEPASPERAEYHHLDHYYQEGEEEEYVPPPAPMRAPPSLSRTSSVLDRLRSLGLYSFLGAEQPAAAAPTDAAFFSGAAPAVADNKMQPAPAHAHYDRSRSEPAWEQGRKESTKQAAEPKMAKSSSATRKPAAPRLMGQQSINTRAEAFIDSFRRDQSQKHLQHHDRDEHEHVVPPPPEPLARTSSVLNRLRSFSLYLRSGDPVPEDPYNKAPSSAADADEKKKKQAAQHARSQSEPAREQGKPKKNQSTDKGMSKASSEADMAEEAAPAEECVDARADDFINKFRQQLQLQRLNSLLNYK